MRVADKILIAEKVLEGCQPHLTAPELPESRARELAGSLVNRYGEKWRHYHTVVHLQDMISFLLENVSDLDNPRPVFWATLGHDSIYLPGNTNGMNERLSAEITAGMLLPHVLREETGAIEQYINATADHHWDGKDIDLAYFLDADMKVLGAPANEFDKYDHNVRKEYSIYEDQLYIPGRIDVLQGFLDQPRLFITDTAHEQFEARARANIERKIGELAAKVD